MTNETVPDYRKITFLAKLIVITLGIHILIDSCLSITEGISFCIGPAPADPNNWDIPHIVVMISELVLNLIMMVALIVNAVFVCKWMHRIYVNMEKAGMQELIHHSKTVLFSWFIPIVWMYRPYLTLKEMYAANGPPQEGRKNFLAYTVPISFRFWAVSWVLCNILGSVTAQLARYDATMQAAELAACASSLMSIVAAGCFIHVVKTITARHVSTVPESAS